MTLDQILQAVEGSGAGDWNAMPVQTIRKWEWGQNPQGNYLEPKTHHKLAVYKPDIDISLAMGCILKDPFNEPWTQKFADPLAKSVAVDLLYRGAVIYGWEFVAVDGNRYLLPMPDPTPAGGYEVFQVSMPLARLFFRLYGVGGNQPDADSALAHAGVAIV